MGGFYTWVYIRQKTILLYYATLIVSIEASFLIDGNKMFKNMIDIRQIYIYF